MVKGERDTYEKCPINSKSPFLTAMDSGTGTQLVSGASYVELELQSARGGACL